jgi:hypothetical protein
MNALRWLTDRFSNRGKALSLYKRGMEKSKNHEHEAAIADYTTAIGMHNVPIDVKAMALYNRALVYAAAGDPVKATSDLNMVLGMAEALPNIKSEARRKLTRMER